MTSDSQNQPIGLIEAHFARTTTAPRQLSVEQPVASIHPGKGIAPASQMRPAGSLSSGIARSSLDAVVHTSLTGVSLGNTLLPPGPTTSIASALTKRGMQVTGRLMRELMVSGVLRRMAVNGDKVILTNLAGKPVPMATLANEIQAGMRANYNVAKVKGTALIIENYEGKLRGLIPGVNGDAERPERSIPIEALSEGLVTKGAYYPAYLVERQLATGMAPFLVPLHFAEEVREMGVAREGFGQTLSQTAVGQVVNHVQKREAVQAAVAATAAVEEKADDMLDALRLGGKVSLGY